MRTAGSLTVSPSMLCSQGGGFCSGGECLLQGGCLLWGVSAPRGMSAPGECLLRGVSALGGWGVSAPGGCLLPGGVCSGRVGVSALGGVCSWGGVCSGGSAPGGCGIPACTEADTPPVNRMTDRCKNITLPQTSFVGGNERNWTDNANITCSILPGKAKVKVLILCHPNKFWPGQLALRWFQSEQFRALLRVEENPKGKPPGIGCEGRKTSHLQTESNHGSSQDLNPGRSSERWTRYHSTTNPINYRKFTGCM